jgi:hypothetical protein
MGRNSCNMGIKKKPENSQNAIICPTHKRGDKQQCSNYSRISLINVCHNILPNVLHEWLVP